MTVSSLDGAVRINLQVRIGNDGSTTTRGLTYNSACVDFPTKPVDPFDRSRLDASRTYTLTLAPKETVRPVLCTFTIEEWARIIAQKGTISIYGRATHRDTVDPRVMHRLEFCSTLYDIGFGAGPFTPGPFALAEECERHNCNDEECDTQATEPPKARNPYAL